MATNLTPETAILDNILPRKETITLEVITQETEPYCPNPICTIPRSWNHESATIMHIILWAFKNFRELRKPM